MGPHASSLTESKGKPHVVNQRGRADRRVEKDARESEDEYVEELFGQLRVVPRPDKARVTDSSTGQGCLVWVRKDLMEARRVRVEDCFPVDWNQKVVGKPISLSFSRDLLSQGWAMYADIVRRSSMADGGGHWVW
jgi:hypothetical protein